MKRQQSILILCIFACLSVTIGDIQCEEENLNYDASLVVGEWFEVSALRQDRLNDTHFNFSVIYYTASDSATYSLWDPHTYFSEDILTVDYGPIKERIARATYGNTEYYFSAKASIKNTSHTVILDFFKEIGVDQQMSYDVALPTLEVHSDTIAYWPGRNSTICATFPNSVLSSSLEPYANLMYLTFYTYNPRNGQFSSKVARYNTLWTIKDMTRIGYDVSLKIGIATQGNPYSGFVSLTSKKNSRSVLLSSLGIEKMVILRPTMQSGPFPSGYMTFITPETKDVVYCNRETPELCIVTCSAVGSQLSDLQIVKITGSLNEEVVPMISKRTFLGYGSFIQIAVPESANGTDLDFMCVATDEESEEMTTMDIQVLILEALQIIEDDFQIDVEYSDNGETATVTASCSALGRPAPTMRIQVLTDEYMLSNNPEETTTTTSGGVTTAIRRSTAEILIHGPPVRATCYAYQPETAINLSVEKSIPVPGEAL